MSKGLTTKEKIIIKSSELFNAYGYRGCSLNDIMKATDLKKGGIYNHFKNKDEIAVEAFDYNYNRVFKRFRERLKEAKTPLDKLYKVIEAFISFAKDPLVKGGGCPIFNTAMDATNSHPALKRKARLGIEGLQTYVQIKLNEGIEAGVFKPGIDVKEIASLFIMTLEGGLIMAQVNESDEYLETAARFLKGYIQTNLIIPGQIEKSTGAL